jgi:hypothetical protein
MALAVALPASAAHNNPWATPEDDVLAKNHDANQEQSIGTPGEDEMRGTMDRNMTSDPGNRGMGGARLGGGRSGGGGGMGGGGHGGR